MDNIEIHTNQIFSVSLLNRHRRYSTSTIPDDSIHTHGIFSTVQAVQVLNHHIKNELISKENLDEIELNTEQML